MKIKLLLLVILLSTLESCIQTPELVKAWVKVENCDCFLWSIIDNRTYQWDGDTFEGYIHGEGELRVFINDSLIESKNYKKNNLAFYGAINKEEAYQYKGDYFVGSLKNGLYEGKGVLLKENGDIYSGEFKSGIPDGTLNYYKKKILRYSGDWKDGRYHGFGVQYLDDNTTKVGIWSEGEITDVEKVRVNYDYGVYFGFIKNNKPSGEGELITYKNDTLFGNWADGKLDGYAEVISDSFQSSGEWENGKLNGHSYCVYSDFSIYNGDFVDNVKSGYGELFYKDELYQGEWANDKFHGLGYYQYENGNSYLGNWKSGIQDGNGTIETETFSYTGDIVNGIVKGYGEVEYKNVRDEYKGHFEDNIRSGNGSYLYENGNVYQGEFANDLFNGIGVFTYNDGSQYQGDFFDGKIYGEGSLYLKEGDSTIVFTAVWSEEGKFPEQASILFPNGDLYEGPIVNGIPTNDGEWTRQEDRETNSATPNRRNIYKANDFFKKHQASINKFGDVLIYVETAALAVAVVAAVAAPLTGGASLVLAAGAYSVSKGAAVGYAGVQGLNALSASIDSAEYYENGEFEKAKEAVTEAGKIATIGAATLVAPPVLRKTGNIIRPILIKTLKPIINKGKTFGKIFSIAIAKNGIINKIKLPAKRLIKGGFRKQTLNISASKRVVNDKANTLKQLLGYGKSGSVLSKNMTKAGSKSIKGTQAHHLIGNDSKCPNSLKLVSILAKHSIDINSAINGLRLPGGHPVAGQKGYKMTSARGQVHQGSHNCKYYDQVYEILKNARTQDKLIEALSTVKKKVYKGELRLNRVPFKNDIFRTKLIRK
ncbi:AHH domain-containing protein [Winogradskyella ludwigii]|uniref:AHH domain-containing protein n=1 Tax=Winogradskyella ludwigii TaxID=2686076 RepID=UPI0015CC97B4|nr:AHH domain-containing protein [Winogradskyella ludwigii]